MKTKLLTTVCSVLFLLLSNNISAQFSPNNLSTNILDTGMSLSFMNNDLNEIPEVLDPFNFIEAGNPEMLNELGTLETHDPEVAASFARAMFGITGGLGFISDQTLWCLGAAYYMQLAMYTNSALYASLGAKYSGSSSDFFTSSLIGFQLQMLMFHSITQYNQVQFLYGALLAYELGSDKLKSGGGKTDITRLTAGLVVGLYVILSTQIAIMVQTNIFAYQSQTLKPESGGEFKDNTTWFLINKSNLLTLSLIWNLRNANR
ncbi:hypothetical protein L3X39_02705 [Sabulilitoribacter multivorans]|uniref:Uncharacterized protein n=1 Tax=Flaviramulus multivorans TaxID=1304750 RepID=A0ABS9IFI8_9FLAO|nr:hypothetical protein [Flaviramulus multivorans]MCF7559532.1 hypothetical protein [Flaviramulus multivorans]